ncbi:MAG TPA: DUF1638 domain-containing protein [Candidatus Wallbacteria bacterium]|nr:MAG: hypothetical protein BWY32_02037 [bacterium ADurb.Bin243]HOD39355.1 DUF1638 domain-containing protein [Candidatus Wallbacteria bacterium]HPG57615.1 DUF1638 domain-containing protein [Candidatus Wallbacteria bacterium]
MPERDSKITLIACSIFKKEIETLQKEDKIKIPAVYLDSMQHMFPERLNENLKKAVAEQTSHGRKSVLIYGECHAFMDAYIANPCAVRVGGMNCIEIFLGRDSYRALRNEGAFFLIPEWAVRWKDIFQKELGLNERNAKDFMKEMHTKIVYLDTGVSAANGKIISEISEYTGLAVEIKKISLDVFLKTLEDAVKRLNAYE